MIRFDSHTLDFRGRDEKGNNHEIRVRINFDNKFEVEHWVNDQLSKKQTIPLNFIIDFDNFIEKVLEQYLILAKEKTENAKSN